MANEQMKEMPLVSICIPAFNNVTGIERLLHSIEQQDYPNIEINISDDSDSDEVEWLIGNSDIDVNYVHNTEKSGLVPNRNAAVRMKSDNAQFVKIMTGDDYFTNTDSLSKFVALLTENPQAAFAFSGTREVVRQGEGAEDETATDRAASDEFIEALQKDYRHLFLGNEIGSLGATIYRASEPAYIFDVKSRFASDMFLYFDILRAHPEFVFTKEPLVSFAVREKRLDNKVEEVPRVSRDYRAYDDYNYMYDKYHLWESEECRKYMIRNVLLPFNRSYAEAREKHISTTEYASEWMAFKLAGLSKENAEEGTGRIQKKDIQVEDYAGHIMRKLTGGALLTTKAEDEINTMVIGWGTVGINWNKKVFVTYVRENRHTISLLQKNKEFTVSVPMEKLTPTMLEICGRQSGRDIDKIKEAELTLIDPEVISVPAIKEVPLTLECKVLYMQKQDLSLFEDESIPGKLYPQDVDSKNTGANKDPHYAIYGEIVDAYIIKS
ncbi:MAG: glycosyltransferase [Lachnospiraceae bacterium]|nr:glycosyltransferase [Lachnospiraceae bacterium]